MGGEYQGTVYQLIRRHFGFPPCYRNFRLMKKENPLKILIFRGFYRSDRLFCDPVGIQTQDLQNRNLTLYSAKLRGLISDAKINILFETTTPPP